jgi:hypothetical protein
MFISKLSIFLPFGNWQLFDGSELPIGCILFAFF